MKTLTRCSSWPQLDPSADGDNGRIGALFRTNQSAKSFDLLPSPTDSGGPTSESLDADIPSPGIPLMPDDEDEFFSEAAEDLPSDVVPRLGMIAIDQSAPTHITVDSAGTDVDLSADDTLPSTTMTEDLEPFSSSGESRSSTPPEPSMPAPLPIFPVMSQSTISAVPNDDDALGFQLLDLDTTPPTPLTAETPRTAVETDGSSSTHFPFDLRSSENCTELAAINEDEEQLSVSDSASSQIDDDDDFEGVEDDNSQALTNVDTDSVDNASHSQQQIANLEERRLSESEKMERERSLTFSNGTKQANIVGDCADEQSDVVRGAVSLTTVAHDGDSANTSYLEHLAKGDDEAVTVRQTPGRKTQQLGARCQSQIVFGGTDNDDRSTSPGAVSSFSLEKSLSSSTPSIDALGQQTQQSSASVDQASDAARDAANEESSAAERSRSAKYTKSSKGSSHSWTPHLPIAFGAHQVIIPSATASRPSKIPSRSQSAVTEASKPEKDKGIKKERSFLGILNRSGRQKGKKMERAINLRRTLELLANIPLQTRQNHSYVPVVCSNSQQQCEVCEKALSKGGALQCDHCEIFVHPACKERASSSKTCEKPGKHPHDPTHRRSYSSASTASGSNVEGLPDVLVEVLQKNGLLTAGRNNLIPDVQSQKPQLVKPKWEDLDIWSEEVEAWSLKYSDLKLSKSDKKRQDVIYELYITEKHHCQVIIVLQQAYQVRLREERVINDKELDHLIPDVLDGLLDFHLNLLRRIRQKQAQSPIVDTISDILYEEFASGDRRQSAIDAYIRFCSMKEDAGRMFVDLKARNAQFRAFFERYESDPDYKERSFKSCLLLITQRLTKYPLLADQMHKYESSEQKELSAAAASAVKRFAGTVDNGLARIEIHRRWDHIQKMLDRSSVAMLHGKRFTYDDLVSFDNDRKVLCIGTVLWQNAVQKPEQVLMILFDDIIIFLINKGGRYHFFSQDKHEPVISLKSLLIREKVRSTAVLLIVAPPAKPDMYEIMFNTKQEMKQWQAALANAHANAQPVRRIREEISLPEKSSGAVDDEQQYLAEMTKWTDELTAIFNTRGVEEQRLKDYMIRRMEWFDQVRRQLKTFPCRSRTDVPERIKSLVRDKFRELRAVRRAALAECIDRAQTTRDEDLPSFFDDAFDAGAEFNWSDSDYSDTEELDKQPTSTTTRAKLPRRIKTFHGTGDNLQKGSFRRHTTVPKLGPLADCVDDVDDLSDGARPQRLPLGLCGRAHRAATKLVRENIELRAENHQLKADVALGELRLAALKARRAPTAAATDTLEALRKKQTEVQDGEREFRRLQDDSRDQLQRRLEELEEKERKIQEQNDLLQERWEVFYKRTGADRNSAVERVEGGLDDDDGLSSDEPRLRHQNSLPLSSDANANNLGVLKSASGSAIPSSGLRASGLRSGSVINSGPSQQEIPRTLLGRTPTTPQQFLAERNGVGQQQPTAGGPSKSKSSSELPMHLASGSTKSDNKKKKK